MRNVFLLDTSWIYYRAKFSLKLTYDVSGVTYHTGTIVGLHNMLLDIFNYDPNAVVLLGADGTPKLHQALNKNYKGSRENQEKNVIDLNRFEIAKQFTLLPNCYLLYHPHLEADEAIGFMCKMKKSDASDRYIVVSRDGDLRQLMDSQRGIFCSLGFEKGQPKLESELTMQNESVKDLEGLTPEEIPLYLAIVGDSSDDIHGIPRFGKNKAKDIVKIVKYPYQLREYINSGQHKGTKLEKQFDKIKDNFGVVEKNFRLTYIDPIYIPDLSSTLKDVSDFSFFEKYGCFNVVGDLQTLIQNQNAKVS